MEVSQMQRKIFSRYGKGSRILLGVLERMF